MPVKRQVPRKKTQVVSPAAARKRFHEILDGVESGRIKMQGSWKRLKRQKWH